MWTVLNNHELLVSVMPGSCIAKDPDNPDDYYVVHYISDRIIAAASLINDTPIEVIALQDLLNGAWWLEE